ncbi:hypothetical protein BBJ28_00013108 [Nothophytophthora sp. Chile5]|nr:hypothetical protein BBJ28_00013108 [Nothophytophthora sp. Chile5]
MRLGAVLALAALLLALRIWLVVVPRRVKASVASYASPLFHQPPKLHKSETPGRRVRIRVMAVLGSGGHTTELLKLMKRLRREVYTPITFVVAETDKTSQAKTELDWKPTSADSFAIIPRSRRTVVVFQRLDHVALVLDVPWAGVFPSPSACVVQRTWYALQRPSIDLSSAFCLASTNLRLLFYCGDRGEAGTCIPICAAVVLFRVLGVHTDSKLIFCESFARVQHLSLTGKLLYYVADEFVVQWPQLQAQYPRTRHLGVIC